MDREANETERAALGAAKRPAGGKAGRIKEIAAVVVATGILVGAYIFLQSTLAKDLWKSWWYAEPENVQVLREGLDLTDKAELVFRASTPLVADASVFNHFCGEAHENTNLMGCYTGGKIYVYGVMLEELEDVNKVTAAHELLHAVWLRLSEKEQAEIGRMLETVREENAEWAEEEVKLYREEERIEELYTRAATKLRELPDELEEHYQRYFNNRQKIVEYYENYQAPFRRLQAENEQIQQELDVLQEELLVGRKEYTRRTESLEEKIAEFNECAETAGCFRSQEVFTRERALLEEERVALNTLREELNGKIDRNNELIKEYEQNLKNLGELNGALSSKYTMHVPYSSAEGA